MLLIPFFYFLAFALSLLILKGLCPSLVILNLPDIGGKTIYASVAEQAQ